MSQINYIVYCFIACFIAFIALLLLIGEFVFNNVKGYVFCTEQSVERKVWDTDKCRENYPAGYAEKWFKYMEEKTKKLFHKQ